MAEQNERGFDQMARECADIFGGLTRPAQTLLVWHLVRESMGLPPSNFLAEKAREYDITEDAAQHYGEAYNTLMSGQLLATAGTVDVKIFGQPDREEDIFRLGPAAAVLIDFIGPARGGAAQP